MTGNFDVGSQDIINANDVGAVSVVPLPLSFLVRPQSSVVVSNVVAPDTAAGRNITHSLTEPTSSDGNNGDIWFTTRTNNDCLRQRKRHLKKEQPSSVKVDGEWKKTKKGFVKVDGVWKSFQRGNEITSDIGEQTDYVKIVAGEEQTWRLWTWDGAGADGEATASFGGTSIADFEILLLGMGGVPQATPAWVAVEAAG